MNRDTDFAGANVQRVTLNSKDDKNNILIAYHTLKFSKKNKDCFDVADIERRSLIVKHMTTRLFNSEDTAAVLLQRGFEDYHALIKDKNGVNNYWKQIKSQLSDVKNDPLKWKSKLEDEDATLNFIRPLTCQKLNTLPCKQRSYNDRDIEKIMNSVKKKDMRSSSEDTKTQKVPLEAFRSARDELYIQEMKRNKSAPKKTLGGRTAANSQFVCPFKRDKDESAQSYNTSQGKASEEVEDERLKNIDPNMIEMIKNEIMDSGKTITWDDIAGLDGIKKIVKEVVVFPMLRPDIFTGLRRPPKGILLFGPPGTGKTLIGKCIASQSKSTFFSISASSLTSKWIGDCEKMVRALFAVAKVYQPSVIFIDEIDSLLTQRSETEHESSRRLKTEFLVQLDGAATSEDDRILIVGATNRPQELDEAARRRLVKRLYVPLPELEARKQIIVNLLKSVDHHLIEEDIATIADKTAGYSGADMTNLCKEASMEPIRSISFSQLENIRMEEVRHITNRDFEQALINVRPSVSQSDLNIYIEWDRTYGSGTAQGFKT
ncbi:PREDICTED: fidgetin-like protein 1 isoform X2 [Wasmannia auropunctata]|uniref:fidgetin-like protein 1 isoform X2 n=1 Tax=Wasmannia auropunctata TaxID=64793 RepID=UPI0005EF631A|nr:PREDICTED: fidgetin-like protein 1 isoform X2 [Wasmannia auropunctata]